MDKIKVELDITSSEEILEQMYQEYLNCPKAIKFLSKLGLSDEQVRNNIAKIYDFVTDINYCNKCPGIEKCKKENALFVTRITFKSGFVDREIAPCKKYLERMRFENQFVIRDFDDAILSKKLSDLDKTEARLQIVNKYAKFDQSQINEWIYMVGGPNTGRSYTASVLTVDIAKKGKGPIIYANCLNRINELVEYYYKDKEHFKEEIDRYSTVPVLVLDDFGNEIKNDVIRDAIIFPILSTRASKKLFTIITSDFKMDEIVNLYSTSKSGEIRAKQIGAILKNAAKKEINLGDISIY